MILKQFFRTQFSFKLVNLPTLKEEDVTSVCFNSLASFKNSIKDVDFSIYLKCY